MTGETPGEWTKGDRKMTVQEEAGSGFPLPGESRSLTVHKDHARCLFKTQVLDSFLGSLSQRIWSEVGILSLNKRPR